MVCFSILDPQSVADVRTQTWGAHLQPIHFSWVYQMDLSQNWVYRNHPESPENSDVVFFCQWEKCDGNIWCSQPWCLGFPWLFHRFSPNLSTPWVERPTPPPMVMPSRRLTWQQPGAAGDIWGWVGWLGIAWNHQPDIVRLSHSIDDYPIIIPWLSH